MDYQAMTFRDKSAYITLDGANEEIMRTKYARSDPRNQDPKGDFAHRARLEAEIDALKGQNAALREQLGLYEGTLDSRNRNIETMIDVNNELRDEVVQIKSENEKMRADAERVCKASEGFQNAASELWKSENPEETTGTIMSLDNAMLLHDESWRALNSAIHYMRKSAAIKDFSTTQKEEECDS